MFGEVLPGIPACAARGVNASLAMGCVGWAGGTSAARCCTPTGREPSVPCPEEAAAGREGAGWSWGQEQAEVQAGLGPAAGRCARAPLPSPGSAAASLLTLMLQYRCSLLSHLAFFISEHHLYRNPVLL